MLLDAASSEEIGAGALAAQPVARSATGAPACSASARPGPSATARRPQLCRKRLGTLDELGVVGTLRPLRGLSDMRPVATQGAL